MKGVNESKIETIWKTQRHKDTQGTKGGRFRNRTFFHCAPLFVSLWIGLCGMASAQAPAEYPTQAPPWAAVMGQSGLRRLFLDYLDHRFLGQGLALYIRRPAERPVAGLQKQRRGAALARPYAHVLDEHVDSRRDEAYACSPPCNADRRPGPVRNQFIGSSVVPIWP
jgi:hypothetical protein